MNIYILLIITREIFFLTPEGDKEIFNSDELNLEEGLGKVYQLVFSRFHEITNNRYSRLVYSSSKYNEQIYISLHN